MRKQNCINSHTLLLTHENKQTNEQQQQQQQTKKAINQTPQTIKKQPTVVKVYSLTTIIHCQGISTNQLRLQRNVNLSVKHDLLFNLY